MITLFKFETEDDGTIIIPMEKIGVTIKDKMPSRRQKNTPKTNMM
jgi:hypothetical protein